MTAADLVPTLSLQYEPPRLSVLTALLGKEEAERHEQQLQQFVQPAAGGQDQQGQQSLQSGHAPAAHDRRA